jgi:hypothetical protein
MFANSPTHLTTSACELGYWRDQVERRDYKAVIKHIPLLVVSVGQWLWKEPMPQMAQQVFWELQDEIAKLPDSGQKVMIARADHLSLLLNAADAAIVGCLIDEFARNAVLSSCLPDR